jgi:hypothetical protein
MVAMTRIVMGTFLLGLLLSSGCVVAEPHEGYYDHDHHRYYHEHSWLELSDAIPALYGSWQVHSGLVQARLGRRFFCVGR